MTGPGADAARIRDGLNDLAALAGRVAAEQAEQIVAIADRYERTLRGGGTLFFAGNGGSAADAQHIAAEIVGRYKQDRPAYAAIALTTDTSALTAVANDYGFEQVFARQVEGLGQRGDVLLVLSTSGRSPNILAALRQRRERINIPRCVAKLEVNIAPFHVTKLARLPAGLVSLRRDVDR